MAAGAFFLLPLNVVAQRFVQYRLELAPLALCNLPQRSQNIRGHLGRKCFMNNGWHGYLRHDGS